MFDVQDVQMKTLEQLKTSITSIPTATAWYLADLGEAKGRQELYTRQSPQALKALREHALIESAISSNRGMKTAYAEFEERFGQVKPPRGEKREAVCRAILAQSSEFTLAHLQRICPGVSVDTIRLLLKELRSKGEIQCVKMGRNAVWKRVKPKSR